jgi:hypothetical protein
MARRRKAPSGRRNPPYPALLGARAYESDRLAMKRIHPGTVLLLALILVLAYSLVIRQRREARLREALALYKERAGGDLRLVMRSNPPLEWPGGTPLGKAIKRIVDSPPARYRFPQGLPILVDPDGLREAGQTLDSPVQAPPKDAAIGEPLPLRQQLRIILEPLGLAAEIKDGAIVITSRGRTDEPAADIDEEKEP